MTLIDHDIDLDPVVELLATKFAVTDRHRLTDLVQRTAARFERAPVRDFIPVLVEHLCSDHLRHQPL